MPGANGFVGKFSGILIRIWEFSKRSSRTNQWSWIQEPLSATSVCICLIQGEKKSSFWILSVLMQEIPLEKKFYLDILSKFFYIE